MPPKRKLSESLSKRFTTEEKVEVQDTLAQAAASISKDTDIQESTETSMPIREQENKNASMHAHIPKNVSTSPPEHKQARKKASETTRKQERTEAPEQAHIEKGVIIDMLYDQIQQKKHLSNGSFRYKADELEKLDAIHRDLDSKKPGRISKNDIARMALIAFYEDYDTNGDDSILAQVFKRM